MKNKIIFFSSFVILAFSSVSAQEKSDTVSDKNFLSGNFETRQIFKRKGNFFFYWGYNRSAYTKSDIHFSGDGYHFSISDVEATDSPTKDFITYVKPNTFTIPQYNYRLGYFLTDKIFISLGEDHMKYDIKKQATHLSGTINSGSNAGEYSNTEVVVGEGRFMGLHTFSETINNPALLHAGHGGGDNSSVLDSLPKGFVSGFEHCDGLNDVSLELGRIEQIWISKNLKHALTVTGTIASGMVIPDTDAQVLGKTAYHNQNKKTYHLAGYSFSASMGIQFDFFRHFFLQGRIKGGYMNLPNIKTTLDGGKASQHFSFLEGMFVVGYACSFEKNK